MVNFVDPPVSSLLAGGAGTAAGLYAYGSSNHKVMCGSVAWAVGSGLALASPLCKDSLIKQSSTTKDASRSYGGNVKCRVIFPDNAEYGLTVDSAAGALATIASLMYCDANMGQVLAGVAGGLIGSTGIQYAYST
jgi:hypothetical protein